MKLKIRNFPGAKFTQHVLSWALLATFLHLLSPSPVYHWPVVVEVASITLVYMFVYYSFLLIILPKYWNVGLGSLILSTFITYLLYAFFIFLYIRNKIEIRLFSFILDSIETFGLLGFAAFSIFLNRLSRAKIMEQNSREKSFLLKEAVLLKNQLDSDLTFDFLYYVQDQFEEASSSGAEAIERFSNIIKYSINTSSGKEISLKEEVIYIADYIGFHKCLRQNTFVEFEVGGIIEEKKVLPRVLIPFIENAFKHGNANEEGKPIRIFLRALPEKISFEVMNWKGNNRNSRKSGLGQVNVKQQLDLFYLNSYSLLTEDTDEQYKIKLELFTHGNHN
jgi:two-component system LytT family sensor kinase